jgi:hypothetical protein
VPPLPLLERGSNDDPRERTKGKESVSLAGHAKHRRNSGKQWECNGGGGVEREREREIHVVAMVIRKMSIIRDVAVSAAAAPRGSREDGKR